MTCTCTHARDAHPIVPTGRTGRVEPCDVTDCPCGNYQEVDGE